MGLSFVASPSAFTDLLRIGVPDPRFGVAGFELVNGLARGTARLRARELSASGPDTRLAVNEPVVGVVRPHGGSTMLVTLDRWTARPRAEEVTIARLGDRPRPLRPLVPAIVWTRDAQSAIGPYLEDVAVMQSLRSLRRTVAQGSARVRSGWQTREIVADGLALAVMYLQVSRTVVVLAGGQIHRYGELSTTVEQNLAGALRWLVELQTLLAR